LMPRIDTEKSRQNFAGVLPTRLDICYTT